MSLDEVSIPRSGLGLFRLIEVLVVIPSGLAFQSLVRV